MLRAAMHIALITVLLAVATSTQAAGWRARASARGLEQQAPRRLPSQAYDARYQNYYRGAYPKYIGGFNAHALQNIGVPSGDVGLRGNGITATPW